MDKVVCAPNKSWHVSWQCPLGIGYEKILNGTIGIFAVLLLCLRGWDHFLNEAHRCGVYMLTLVGENSTNTTCQARASYQYPQLRGLLLQLRT